MENKEFFSLFPEFRFDEKIENPLELISHSNVISTNALNTIVANAIEKSKLGEAGFVKHDIFSSPALVEKVQLRVTYGVGQTKILEAIVTPNLQPADYVVACVLFSKMQDARWRIVQSHKNGDDGYVYIKMRKRDLLRFHGKMYEWDGARVTFCMVQTILPIIDTSQTYL
jgi:hypothetical protein